MCLCTDQRAWEWGWITKQNRDSSGAAGEGDRQTEQWIKTYNQHLQIWCWDSFLPAPASLSSGYSSQLLLGSACRPSRGNRSEVYSQRYRPAARSVNQLEPLNSLKEVGSLQTGKAPVGQLKHEFCKHTEWISITGFGNSNRKIKLCFSWEQHLMSNGGQEGATTRCVGGVLWSDWQRGRGAAGYGGQ